jgi:O-antigen ligase
MATTCPNCGSPRTRRGGGAIWTIYLVLIALALPLVLTWKFSAAIFAAVMLAIIVLSHLAFPQRICLDCGEHWRPQ